MIKRIFGSKIFLAGLGLLVVGCSPLLIYVLYEFIAGSKGGNPVGLGLLFIVSFLPAVILMITGIVLSLIHKDKAVSGL